jgi:hypothetical protein
MLGLSIEPPYLAYLLASYPGLWWSKTHAEHGQSGRTNTSGGKEGVIRKDVEVWLEAGLPTLFEQAVREATNRRLSSKLATYVAGIVRNPSPLGDEVGDLPTLAAWALDHLLRRRCVMLCVCDLCGRPWILPERHPEIFCHRPRPGLRLSCFEAARQERWARLNRDWRREYKKLHERTRAGSLSPALFDAWRGENKPSSWVPLEKWISGKARPDMRYGPLR